jgi:carnitine monooxygenase subunit
MATSSIARLDRGDRFHPDPERSYTLPSRYYYDEDIYQREREAIFYKNWLYVCHSETVREPGDYTTFETADQNIIVVRGKDGVLRGFYNVCAHRAHELLKGEGRTKVITCPYHAWSYHIDGTLRTARGSEKIESFDKDEFCLTSVRAEEFCNFVFINMDNDAVPLAEQSKGLAADIRSYVPDLDQLTHAHRLTFDIKANWKNVLDNFLECYHCPATHPAFANGLIDLSTFGTVTYGIYSTHHSKGDKADNAAYNASDADDPNHSVWWLWPNTCILRFPGAANLSIWRMIPTGPETTREIFDFFLLDKTVDEQSKDAIDYIDKVLQIEDIAVVESVQRGFHSRAYDQGRFIVDPDRGAASEHGVHHFQALVRQHIDE